MDYKKLIQLTQNAQKISQNIPQYEKILEIQQMLSKLPLQEINQIRANTPIQRISDAQHLANTLEELHKNEPVVYDEISSIIEPVVNEYSDEDLQSSEPASKEMNERVYSSVNELFKLISEKDKNSINIPLIDTKFTKGELIGIFLSILSVVIPLLSAK